MVEGYPATPWNLYVAGLSQGLSGRFPRSLNENYKQGYKDGVSSRQYMEPTTKGHTQ